MKKIKHVSIIVLSFNLARALMVKLAICWLIKWSTCDIQHSATVRGAVAFCG